MFFVRDTMYCRIIDITQLLWSRSFSWDNKATEQTMKQRQRGSAAARQLRNKRTAGSDRTSSTHSTSSSIVTNNNDNDDSNSKT